MGKFKKIAVFSARSNGKQKSPLLPLLSHAMMKVVFYFFYFCFIATSVIGFCNELIIYTRPLRCNLLFSLEIPDY